ncbi:MAG: PPK2 family polyphosphate kinase [Planctomycetaceae bacterium]
MKDFNQLRIRPSTKVRLREIETDGKDLVKDRAEYEQSFLKLREELIDLQARLYAESRQKLLVVFQAMDGGGKDGTIRSVFQGVNPQGVVVTSFKAPTSHELAHDFLWRIHQAVPPNGYIGVFNRSHYEDVLVVRVHRLVSEEVWKPRFELINDFERMLTQTGTRIVKFFLHISKAEQKQRFEERISDPAKRWKFDPADLEKRKLWDEYEAAFEDMLEKCSTKDAPWYVIPADQNWFRDYAVCRVLVETLRDMKPRYPDPPDVSGIVVQ